LAECIRDVIIKKLHSIVIAASDYGSGFVQVIHVILRKVLQLYQPASPSTGTIGSIELEHTVSSAVFADSILHGLIFLHGGFGKLQAECKRLFDISVGLRDHVLHIFFTERFCFNSIIREPFFHLHYAVWIIDTGKVLHLQYEC